MGILLKNLEFEYKKTNFKISIDNYEIVENSITSLIGPNGAGKTTLLHLLAGLYNLRNGSIEYDNLNFNDNKLEIYETTFFSFESSSFYSNLSSYKNLEVFCIYNNIKDYKSKINDALEFAGLENSRKTFGRLSTGNKQKLNIAAIYIKKPKYLILDEPFNGLDPSAVFLLKNLLQELKHKHATTTVVSTHLLNEADAFCTHYAIMSNGSILDNGSMIDEQIKLEEKYKNSFNIK